MEPKDLKTGMFVICRNDELRLVLGSNLIALTKGGIPISDYTNSMRNTSDDNIDIIKVYEEPHKHRLAAGLIIWMTGKHILKYTKLLWERESTLEVTMDDIEKKYGCKVKIVKDS